MRKYICRRDNREVDLYEGHCLGCSLFPFNVDKNCPYREKKDEERD